MIEVLQQLGNRRFVEEVVQDSTATRSNMGVLVTKAPAKGGRRVHACQHQAPLGGSATMRDRQLLDDGAVLVRHHSRSLAPTPTEGVGVSVHQTRTVPDGW